MNLRQPGNLNQQKTKNVLQPIDLINSVICLTHKQTMLAILKKVAWQCQHFKDVGYFFNITSKYFWKPAAPFHIKTILFFKHIFNSELFWHAGVCKGLKFTAVNYTGVCCHPYWILSPASWKQMFFPI